MIIEKTMVKGNKDHWECICGNNTMGLGFQTCNQVGDFTEPTSNWSGLYACQSCGRIIDQDTREIVGHNPSAYTYDDYLKDNRN